MMLVCAALILIPLPISAKLYTLRGTALENNNLCPVSPESKIGGNPLHGFAEFVANPYLLGIGMFIILYTGIGSFVYLEQKNLLAPYSRADRATIYGIRDAVTNTITFALAFFVTGRLVPRLGHERCITDSTNSHIYRYVNTCRFSSFNDRSCAVDRT